MGVVDLFRNTSLGLFHSSLSVYLQFSQIANIKHESVAEFDSREISSSAKSTSVSSMK